MSTNNKIANCRCACSITCKSQNLGGVVSGTDGWGATPAQSTNDNLTGSGITTENYSQPTVYFYAYNGRYLPYNTIVLENGNYIFVSQSPNARLVGCAQQTNCTCSCK